jgi:hypothetical protein
MKKRTLSILAVLASIATTWVASAHAASGSGNGGGAVVCRDIANGNKIFHVELYDLWEAVNLSGLKLKTELKDQETEFELAVQKLIHVHSYLGQRVAQELKVVQKKIRDQQEAGLDGAYLADVNDSNHLLVPKFCPGRPDIRPAYEQAVNYTDGGALLVDLDI